MSNLALAHITAQARIRAHLASALTAVWTGLPGYDEENLPQWLATALPLVAAAQRSSAVLTNTYLAHAVGRPPLALDVAKVTGAAARAGATPADVYRRPFVEVWTELSKGTEYNDAVRAGLHRATSTGETDVQLTMRDTTRAVGLADTRIVGFQRIPDGGACDLCLIAATQRYRVGDLMPIHNHCGCGTKPIIGHRDPGQVINHDALAELRASGAIDRITEQRQASRVAAAHDAGVDVAIHEHGELGPVLTMAGDHFTHL